MSVKKSDYMHYIFSGSISMDFVGVLLVLEMISKDTIKAITRTTAKQGKIIISILLSFSSLSSIIYTIKINMK